MTFLSEAAVEQALLDQLRVLGYGVGHEEFIGPDGKHPERESHDEVILRKRFEGAVARLNPGLPPEAQQDAIRQVLQSELPSLLEENRRLHKLMTEGVDVEYYADDGTLTAGKVRLIDFEQPENNDWLAVSQFTVISGQYRRRPDVVVFLNGLPVGVIELKAPGSAGAHLRGAFQQLQTYKSEIPALFHTNALLVTSDGIGARVGSLSADLERFMPWRTTDGTKVAPKGEPELSTLVEGVFEHSRLLELLHNPIGAISANITLPFLNAHKKELARREAETSYQQNLANYRQTLYRALGETQNAILNLKQSQDEARHLQERLAQAKDIENLTRIRYQAGAASLQDVLDKENATRGVEESLLTNRYEQLTRSLTLHLALGGNLQDNESARPQPSPTAREGE